MKVEVSNNSELGELLEITVKSDDDWDVDHDALKPQRLYVHVTADKEEDVHNEVGLIQTLLASSRVATYAGGGKLELKIKQLPCLDAHPDTKPFFDAQCVAKLEKLHDAKALELQDNPVVGVTYYAHHGEDKTKKPLEKLEVDESFLVSLYNETKKEVIHQWTWKYKYTMAPDENGFKTKKPKVTINERGVAKDKTTLDHNIPTDKNAKVAGELFHREWTPGWTYPGWEGN